VLGATLDRPTGHVTYRIVEPRESGYLSTSDGHEIYFERFGRPGGVPVVYLHGGPGSGASVSTRRYFDPDRFDVVFFDQRGCGQSRPLAEETDADLSTNTTKHLIDDMEALRERCGIERWIVVGWSWGCTLALAYAETHVERTRAVLGGLPTTTSTGEVDWITRAVGRVFPEQYERFTSYIPVHLRELRNVDAYAELLFDPDPAVREGAAREWCAWEEAHVSLAPGYAPNPRYDDPAFRLRFARLVTHYWRHSAFLDDDQLMAEVHRLSGVPGVLIAGRFDISGPLYVAWRLHRDWPSSEFIVLENSGHGDGDEFADAITASLERLATIS